LEILTPGIPKKPQHVFFLRVCPDHPRCRRATWICMCGHTRDIVIFPSFIEIRSGVSEPHCVKIWPFPLLWLLAFTTTCATVQAVINANKDINRSMALVSTPYGVQETVF